MINFDRQIDGDDWQEFILQLLYQHYGADLIEVPDEHKGDSGIEAFSLDGCAFQCYAPEGEVGPAETAKKHKKKITRDLGKLRANAKELTKILGVTKIRRWLLVVPDHCSSDVVTHCQAKTDEIRALVPPLPYIAADFHALTVNGYSFFSIEIARLQSSGGLLVEATETSVAQSEIHAFSVGNNEQMETLETKLSKLPSLNDDAERADLTKRLLAMYLQGSNAIADYDRRFPAIADKIRSLKQSKSTRLEIDSKIQDLTIAGTRKDFESELVSAVPGLGRHTALVLSYASIAEWLMLCPLNPKG